MRQWFILKIGYVCQIPPEGGGRAYLANNLLGQRHVNHPPIDHPYKCHENTNHSRAPQLSKAPIPTSKWKYVPNLLQT